MLLPRSRVPAKTARWENEIVGRVIPLTETIRLSDGEELANAISHGTACLVALSISCYLIATHSFSNGLSQLGFFAYACSLIIVLFASTVSHIVRDPEWLHFWRAWDQGTIYLLIAGTYTPGIIAFCHEWTEGVALLLVWGLAAFGFYSKVIAKHRVSGVATINYLALGWLPALILFPQVSRTYFLWLLAGGLSYSMGVWFLVNDHRVKFFHLVWHLWVTLAAGIHYYAICTMAI